MLLSSLVISVLQDRTGFAWGHESDSGRCGTGLKSDNDVNSCSDLTELRSLNSIKVGRESFVV